MQRLRLTAVVTVIVLGFLAGNAMAAARTGGGHVIHGEWKIEVYDPDGTLVRVVEYENDLNGTTGAKILVDLVSGAYVPGGVAILLLSNDPGVVANPCQHAEECFIGETGVHYSGFVGFSQGPLSTDLAASIDTGIVPHRLVFQGTLAANQSGNIKTLSTLVKTCATNSKTIAECRAVDASSPPAGYSPQFRTLSGHSLNLTQEIDLVADQVVKVTVKYYIDSNGPATSDTNDIYHGLLGGQGVASGWRIEVLSDASKTPNSAGCGSGNCFVTDPTVTGYDSVTGSQIVASTNLSSGFDSPIEHRGSYTTTEAGHLLAELSYLKYCKGTTTTTADCKGAALTGGGDDTVTWKEFASTFFTSTPVVAEQPVRISITQTLIGDGTLN